MRCEMKGHQRIYRFSDQLRGILEAWVGEKPEQR